MGSPLSMVMVLVGVVIFTRINSTTFATPALATSAPAIVHGQLLPTAMARVGTLSGGVVRQLLVGTGDTVQQRAALALVESSAGAEVVTAPFSGTATNVLVHVGDTVSPGATIAIVADLHALHVETTDVDQFLVARLHPGDVVPITIDAIENLSLRGTVRSVAGLPQTDAISTGQTYPIVVDIGTPPREVRAGMTVRITLPTD